MPEGSIISILNNVFSGDLKIRLGSLYLRRCSSLLIEGNNWSTSSGTFISITSGITTVDGALVSFSANHVSVTNAASIWAFTGSLTVADDSAWRFGGNQVTYILSNLLFSFFSTQSGSLKLLRGAQWIWERNTAVSIGGSVNDPVEATFYFVAVTMVSSLWVFSQNNITVPMFMEVEYFSIDKQSSVAFLDNIVKTQVFNHEVTLIKFRQLVVAGRFIIKGGVFQVLTTNNPCYLLKVSTDCDCSSGTFLFVNSSWTILATDSRSDFIWFDGGTVGTVILDGVQWSGGDDIIGSSTTVHISYLYRSTFYQMTTVSVHQQLPTWSKNLSFVTWKEDWRVICTSLSHRKSLSETSTLSTDVSSSGTSSFSLIGSSTGSHCATPSLNFSETSTLQLSASSSETSTFHLSPSSTGSRTQNTSVSRSRYASLSLLLRSTSSTSSTVTATFSGSLSVTKSYPSPSATTNGSSSVWPTTSPSHSFSRTIPLVGTSSVSAERTATPIVSLSPTGSITKSSSVTPDRCAALRAISSPCDVFQWNMSGAVLRCVDGTQQLSVSREMNPADLTVSILPSKASDFFHFVALSGGGNEIVTVAGSGELQSLRVATKYYVTVSLLYLGDPYIDASVTVSLPPFSTTCLVSFPCKVLLILQPISLPITAKALEASVTPVSATASAVGGAAATDLQALAVIGLMSCSSKFEKDALGNYQSLTPFPLFPSLLGVLLGSAVLIACCTSMALLMIVLFTKVLHKMNFWAARAKFRLPGLLYSLNCALYQGLIFSSLQLMVTSGFSVGERLAGVAGSTYSALILISMIWINMSTARGYFSLQTALDVRLPWWRRALWFCFMPLGKLAPKRVGKSYGPVMASRLPGMWWSTASLWSPTLIALWSIFDISSPSACAVSYGLLAALHVVIAAVLLVFRPGKTRHSHVLSPLAALITACVLCVSAASGTGVISRTTSSSLIGSVALLQTALTVVRILCINVSFLFERVSQKRLGDEPSWSVGDWEAAAAQEIEERLKELEENVARKKLKHSRKLPDTEFDAPLLELAVIQPDAMTEAEDCTIRGTLRRVELQNKKILLEGLWQTEGGWMPPSVMQRLLTLRDPDAFGSREVLEFLEELQYSEGKQQSDDVNFL